MRAPWKYGGEVNDLTFDQYPEGRTSRGLAVRV